MKNYFKVVPTLLFFPFFVSAQSNYKPGYMVTQKGDTVKGFIDYREWEKNPKQISFKARPDDKQATEITPANAAAFGVAGLEYYESHMVSVSMDRLEIDNISNQGDPTNLVTDTVFLKILARGKYVSLYSYTDNIKSRFYLSEKGNLQQPEELGYHAHYTGDQTNTIEYTRRYRTQLQYEAQKNNVSGLERQISGSRYSADELISIVSKINGGSSQQLVSKSLFGTRWFAGVGVNYNDMNFTGDVQYGDAYSLFPKFSVGLDILPNKNTQQFFFRAEAAFTGDSHDFKNAYEQSELKFNQFTASAILQAYYNFYNGEKLKAFVGGGIAVNFSSYPNTFYTSEIGIDLTPTRINNFPDYHKLWESFLIKAGINVGKRIEIYAAYSPPTTLTNNFADFAGNVTSYQAGINYLFSAK